MVGGANRYHDTQGDARGPKTTGRTMDAGPGLPVGLRGTLIAFLALVLVGMIVEAIADAGDLNDTDEDSFDHFTAATLKAFAAFGIGVCLLWGASESRQLSTGIRVGLLVMGSVFVLHGSTDSFVSVSGLFAGLFGGSGFPFG